MTRADERLKALFAVDEPPPRDVVFSTAVLERLVRRQFQEDVALLSGVTLVGAGALWAAWPTLLPALVTVSQALAPAIATLALVACAALLMNGRGGSALAEES